VVTIVNKMADHAKTLTDCRIGETGCTTKLDRDRFMCKMCGRYTAKSFSRVLSHIG
jgi:hypothetical protein